MNKKVSRILGASTGILALAALTAATLERGETPSGPPEATVDLATDAGVKLVKGQWRYHDTKIVDVGFRAAGPDGQPTGTPVKTYDYEPHAGGADSSVPEKKNIGKNELRCLCNYLKAVCYTSAP